jgi:hypothetical protein
VSGGEDATASGATGHAAVGSSLVHGIRPQPELRSAAAADDVENVEQRLVVLSDLLTKRIEHLTGLTVGAPFCRVVANDGAKVREALAVKHRIEDALAKLDRGHGSETTYMMFRSMAA